MNLVVKKEKIGPAVWRMQIEAPRVAKKAQAGQFIILRADAQGERVPLTVADTDPEAGTVTIIFQEIGASTMVLARIPEGGTINDFAGPLGNPSLPHFEGAKRALCIGGGVGTAVVYPQVKALSRQASVDVITGARSKEHLILLDELSAMADHVYIATDDGSQGHHGFVTDILKELLEKGERYDVVVAIGPAVMMRAVCSLTKPHGIKTIVSLNPIMVDGTGMCGGCRVTVGGQVKYACVDGPDFDGHEVDFDELIRRGGMYRKQEADLVDHVCKVGLNGQP